MPKVKFEVGKLVDYFGIMDEFLNPKKEEMNWSRVVYSEYPELKKKLAGAKNKSIRLMLEEDFFRSIEKKRVKEMERRVKVFQREWDMINDDVMMTLSQITEINWAKDDKLIRARVNLNPICPRYIKERVFDLFWGFDVTQMKSVSIHEIFHFIYFEKWKKVFPKTREIEFDSPYLVWKLSEMVTGVVLNDERIQKVFSHRFYSYDEYESIKIKKRFLLDI